MQNQKSLKFWRSDNGCMIAGYISAFLTILLLPIIFMPVAIIMALDRFLDKKVIRGLLIMIIAITLGLYGAHIGGWGFGLPKFLGTY